MAVKTIVDWARALPGCLGIAVYAGESELYNDSVERDQAKVLCDLLGASTGARQASAALGSITLVSFYAGDCTVLLKIAGRFPVLPEVTITEPVFVDPSCAPVLPSQAEARREAEAALLKFGLL